MTETIDLSLLAALAGAVKPAEEGLFVEPAGDGGFCLSLDKAASGARWAPERWLVVDMNVDMDRMPVVHLDFVERRLSGGPKGDPSGRLKDGVGAERVLTVRYFMVPGRRVKMAVRLSELDSHRFFLPAYPGSLKGHVEGEPTHIDAIGELRLRLRKNDSCRGFALYGIYLADELPDMRIAGEPLVDKFGQRKGHAWPGKMGSERELVAYLRAELGRAESEERSGAGYPEGWSRFGGWKRLKFDATGFFHTRHDGRRWWLVDPDGYAFYSNGVCYASRMGVHGFVDRMESMFDWLPDHADPTWRECWTEASEIPEFAKRNGAAAGRGRAMFNFPRANMIRAFGPEGWWKAWLKINAARMRRWGINTIGVGVNNYVDERVRDFLAEAKIPYVLTLKNFPLTGTRIYRDFPDVFGPEYSAGAAEFAREQLGPFVGDPYLIGYFITNEPEWLFQDSVNPAERVLAHDGELSSKEVLIDFLRGRYGDDVARLNAAWGTSLDDFSGLRRPLEHADLLSEASRFDLSAFRDVLIAKYSSVPSEALAAVDPDHLNLGMRYARLSANELAGNGSFDICSFNCYRPDPRPSFDIVAKKDSRPGLVGEWHVAASEMRNFATGLVYSPDQTERAKACRFYMEQAMAHPASVGAHYFEWNDQPVLGRFDGECMQHGLISLCNVPYPEMEAMLAELAPRIYEIVNGDRPPTEERGQTVGNYS